MDAQLPSVFSDALMVEDDPATLDAYARGLWHQWQAMEKMVSEVPRKGYPKETVKAAFAWLMDAYVEAEAPIPYELARLARAIAKPKPGVSTAPVQAGSEKAYWEAIMFEANFPASKPATLYKVAQHLRDEQAFRSGHRDQKSAESTVKGWRALAHYRANVQLYRREK